MESYNAIKQAVSSEKELKISLPLRNKILLNINKEAAKQGKRNYIYNIILVSITSLILVGITIYIMITYTNVNFAFPTIDLSIIEHTHFYSSFYFALIISFLLMLDGLFRKKYVK